MKRYRVQTFANGDHEFIPDPSGDVVFYADMETLLSAANRAAIVLGEMESELRAGERRTLWQLREALSVVNP